MKRNIVHSIGENKEADWKIENSVRRLGSIFTSLR
jgi:hypothetical protein